MRNQGGRKNSCFLVQKFLPRPFPRKGLCFFSMLSVSTLVMSEKHFSATPIQLEGTFCSHCFWKKVLTPVAWPSSREVNLHAHDKRDFKTSSSSYEPESEEKEESETLRTHEGLVNVMVSLMELWSLVFLAAKPNTVCVCAHACATGMFSSTLTSQEEPDFWLCHKTLEFKQGFTVRKDAVRERWEKWELQKNVLDFGKEINQSQHNLSEWKENKGWRN